MVIGHVWLFFSFTYDRDGYACALVEWVIPGDNLDEDTGMWVVRPEFHRNGWQMAFRESLAHNSDLK